MQIAYYRYNAVHTVEVMKQEKEEETGIILAEAEVLI